MPRKNRRFREDSRPVPSLWANRVVGPGGQRFVMRPVPANAARKRYTCPHCFGAIMPGQAHVVAWPVEDSELRRHWHSGCWQRRG